MAAILREAAVQGRHEPDWIAAIFLLVRQRPHAADPPCMKMANSLDPSAQVTLILSEPNSLGRRHHSCSDRQQTDIVVQFGVVRSLATPRPSDAPWWGG